MKPMWYNLGTVVGFACVEYGVWQYSPRAAWILGGLFVMAACEIRLRVIKRLSNAA